MILQLISLTGATVLCDWGSGQQQDGRGQTALVELHHGAVAEEKVRGGGGFIPAWSQSAGLGGVEGAVELLRPTEPRLSGLQVRPGGAGQRGRLGGGREKC